LSNEKKDCWCKSKEVRAAQTRIEIGVSTLAEETAILTGGDFERKYPQILKEYKLKQEAGLIPKEVIQPQQTTKMR
jgi:capsid protein